MPRPQRQERGVSEQERPGPWPAFLPQPSCCPRGQGAGVGSALHSRGSWTSEGKAQQKGPLLAQDVGWPSQEFGPCRPWGRVGDPRCRAVSANPTLLKDHPLPCISPRGAEQLWSRPWGCFWKQGRLPPPATGAAHTVAPGSLFPCVRRPPGQEWAPAGAAAGQPVCPQAPGAVLCALAVV